MTKSKLLSTILKFFQKMSSFKSIEFLDDRFSESTGIYCVGIKLSMDIGEWFAYGQGLQRDEAAFKAVMELVERYIVDNGVKSDFVRLSNRKDRISFDQLKIKYPQVGKLLNHSSNGVSVHLDSESCIWSSTNELIERHTLLKAQACGITPFKLNGNHFAQKWNLPSRFEYSCFLLKGGVGRFVCIAEAKSITKSCYGFGCAESIEKAIEKASMEMSSRLSLLCIGDFLEDELTILHPNFNQAYKRQTTAWLEQNEVSFVPSIDPHITAEDIWICELRHEFFNKIGICAVQAVSPIMQPLFVGDWNFSVINKLAIDVEELPSFAHIVG